MYIPDYQTIMLPLLQFASDQHEHSLRQTIEALADDFQLTDEARRELLPSGRQATFNNRVGWARTYLKKAGLVESTRRGYFRITKRGLNVVTSNPDRIDNRYLEKFPEYLEFKSSKKESLPSCEEYSVNMSRSTPEEELENVYQKINSELASDLLQTVKQCSPSFFESLVVDVLVKMGYGGTRKDAGQTVGQSQDGGIDGIIKEDRLGLDKIYIQAKRWENPVGRPEIQKFAGALQGVQARKGVFITSSTFTKEAKEFVNRIDSSIVLIDGNSLAQFMIEFNVGVTAVDSYIVKKVDSDYFEDG